MAQALSQQQHIANQGIRPNASHAAPVSSAATAQPILAPSTPSLVAILAAFEKNGRNDVELLKSILKAKEKEDERLAADAALKAEQLKVQHTLVLSQIYYAQQAQQQYAASCAPYSPTSPPVDHAPLSPFHLIAPRSSFGSDVSSPPESLKRSRAPSDASSSRSETSDVGAKRIKRSASATSATYTNATKPTHEQVMAALRSKCERNAASKHNASNANTAQQQSQQRTVRAAEAPRLSPPTLPRIMETPASMAPPSSRSTKSASPPARHSALLAQSSRLPAPAPSASDDQKSPSLKMLLNAVNTHSLARTSDTRSEQAVHA
ncbi:hypothetical protein OIO90_005953 [Microbotryomycetes sp. JL221]|nr:hypothetical protein OIO90_005953 [Microbotryomycetes sp. JL221]